MRLSVLEFNLIYFTVSERKKLFLTEFLLFDVFSVHFRLFMTLLVHSLAFKITVGPKAHRYSKS